MDQSKDQATELKAQLLAENDIRIANEKLTASKDNTQIAPNIKPKLGRPIKKHAGGRPLKFNGEVIRKLEYAFSIDCSVNEACLHAGISPVCFYENIKLNQELANHLQQLREKPVLLARENINNAIRKKDKDSSKWYLERKRKNEFSPSQQIDYTSQGEKITAINYVIPKQLKDLNDINSVEVKSIKESSPSSSNNPGNPIEPRQIEDKEKDLPIDRS